MLFAILATLARPDGWPIMASDGERKGNALEMGNGRNFMRSFDRRRAIHALASCWVYPQKQ